MNIQQFLAERDVAFEVLDHRPTYDAQRMAHVLHKPGDEIAKTVLLRADHGYAYIVAVLPAGKRVNLERASHVLGGSQLDIASEGEIAERCIDCERGVLPPFGSQYGLQTLIDRSLVDQEEIYFEGNSHHEAIGIQTADFLRTEQPLVSDFAE